VPRRIVGLIFVLASFLATPLCLPAQDFKLLGREVEVHGFASQGFIYTNTNNWLTTNSSQGSAAFTEFGFNLSTRVADRLWVGAQFYDHNLGQLGQYHPSLDWAVIDYRVRSWLRLRGGKVKTTMGLYTDSQDLDFLHTFVLLPQSVYPIDLRDATMAHSGGDVYGNISLPRNLGELSYTAYAGHRSDSIYSGYPYLLSLYGTRFTSFGGLQYGADLRWTPPIKGLLLGVSRMNQDTSCKGTSVSPINPTAGPIPYSETSKADWTNQFYGQYKTGKLKIDSEYRRYLRDQVLFSGSSENLNDLRGWYVSGTYRVTKRITLGSYYSSYKIRSFFGGVLARVAPNQTDTNLPANHIYDKVISARFDVKRFWNVKLEGHFMNGYGATSYPDGFYGQVNPQGFAANTNALVLKTSVSF
jgi:hypothetical protein